MNTEKRFSIKKVFKFMGPILVMLPLLAFMIIFPGKRPETKSVNAITTTNSGGLLIKVSDNEIINVTPIRKQGCSLFHIVADGQIVEHKFIGDKEFVRLTLNEEDFQTLRKTVTSKGEYVGTCYMNNCQAYVF